MDETIVRVEENELWVDGMGRSRACVGDSGGPLLVLNQYGEVEIAGVLDRGSADCLGIDVYTRADVLRDWVAQWRLPSPRAPCTDSGSH